MKLFNKITKGKFLIVALLTSANVFASEGRDGAGGDAIRCNEKLYALDYFQTQSGNARGPEAIKNAKDTKEILKFLSANLKTKLPELSANLEDFIKFNDNEVDNAEKRLWIGGTLPLVDIKDEGMLRTLPEACRKPNGALDLLQAVIRKDGKVTEYYYDEKVLKELEENSPEQLSYIYLHEWLRDFTSDR